MKEVVVVADPEVDVGDTINEYKTTRNPVIVDTGGFSNKTTAISLVHCDFALIP